MSIRWAASALVIAAQLLAAGDSAFCVPANHSVMPCCKSAASCGAGMRASDCCRFVPATPAQAPSAVEPSVASMISRQETQGAALVEIALGAFVPTQASTQAPPLLFFQRDLSVSLYILNSSLLR